MLISSSCRAWAAAIISRWRPSASEMSSSRAALTSGHVLVVEALRQGDDSGSVEVARRGGGGCCRRDSSCTGVLCALGGLVTEACRLSGGRIRVGLRLRGTLLGGAGVLLRPW